MPPLLSPPKGGEEDKRHPAVPAGYEKLDFFLTIKYLGNIT